MWLANQVRAFAAYPFYVMAPEFSPLLRSVSHSSTLPGHCACQQDDNDVTDTPHIQSTSVHILVSSLACNLWACELYSASKVARAVEESIPRSSAARKQSTGAL